MISPPKESELFLDNGEPHTTNNISNGKNNEFEVERENIATHNLQEKLSQTKLIIEQFESMIKSTFEHIKHLASEFQKSEKDYTTMVEERRVQKEYESKEIDFLKSELGTLQKTLEIQNEKLEKIQNKNMNLKNAISANRFKIFKVHFNGLDDEKFESTESNCTSLNTTSEETETSVESTAVESSELSDEA